MSEPLTPPQSLNHVAYPTWSSQETYDFYTGVLNCRFLAAIQLDQVPSTGTPTPFLHTFFGFESGEAIAFFEVDGMERPGSDPIPSWVRHLALNVASTEDLHRWIDRLKAAGVETLGVVDHDGTWESVYFFDPNGVRIELTVQHRPLTDADQADGLETLRRWNERRSVRA
ncbi:VOC family protein [Phytohabitans sp. ZYX-F-186]|uniref:VOC family protein n=1 Tax=Phytohabitans maris TaxID=3071409 RepID=A0ABU0ZSZ0_9ACTN|nr:VOC family protein [Phytohabitans sp. ZYX-F-186]MDQ7910155.1 VOC family protein [Phytohabitans sp. ZYX-F-186]